MTSSTDTHLFDPWLDAAAPQGVGSSAAAHTGLQIATIENVEPLDAQLGAVVKKTVPDALHDALFGQPELSPTEIDAAGGDPAAVPPMQTYAVLDAAKIVHLPDLLADSRLEYRCLFTGDAYDEMKDVAPWVVRLEEGNNFTRRLFTGPKGVNGLWNKEAGIYVRSRATLEDMWRHFRKFTKVRNNRENWLYLRWWEPSFWYLALLKQVGQIQRDLTSPLDALVVPLELPMFGDRWLSLHTEGEGAGGEHRLSDEDLKDIRLTTNLRDCLMILDGFARTRFKGLGVHHTIRFVRHALATAEHFGLQYRDQTAYLMFVMNFLGSWFWHDPRFPKMADILHSSTLSNHRKIEELHAAFSQFSTNFIGDDYSLYWAALARTEAKLPPLLENAASDEAVLRAQVECHGRPDVIRHFPAAAFLERSRHAADAIGMSSPRGYRASVILSYWFGTGYYNDPLFPWIAEKAGEQRTADSRARSVLAYALKRMQKTRMLGGHDVL